MTVYWRKSSRSGAGASNCVEVARSAEEVRFRDSKAPGAGQLVFGADGFQRFRAAVAAQLPADVTTAGPRLPSW
ncbi:hypothetical protein JOF41_005996 [Saccharothrix coeruleofusca]|uniref:DUF397 domain-containing protein n=1 Tax=Saccharothrix coeruleofusca TaxID=33919 RepID=UPI001AEA2B30|nr:DUF397 domain-containing protein [Saccharothrix coeruleofusca]MBP2339818.1 hypothetical protein [Saccharothrix coeruleofusca]